MSVLSNAVGKLAANVKEALPTAVVTALFGGKDLTTVLTGTVKDAAQESLAQSLEEAGISATPEAYATRIAGDPGVKRALRASGVSEVSPGGKAILLATVTATFRAEEKDLRALGKGISK